LLSSLNDLDSTLNRRRESLAERSLSLTNDLLLLCDWLITHPHPVFVNAHAPPEDHLLFLAHPSEYSALKRIRLAFTNSLFNLNALPPRLFCSRSADQVFVRRCVSAALATRKPGTSFFEPLPCEERLRLFLDSANSPLFGGTLDFADGEVKNWVTSAAATLVRFEDLPDSSGHDGVLAIFAARYLFERAHPRFGLAGNADAELATRREAIRKMTPAKIGIGSVPEAARERPVVELFKVDALAAIEWEVCPVDTAFAIFRANEALEGVAAREDILAIWVAAIAVSDIGDPRAVVEFINRWAVLPAFPRRFLAACACMEAAVGQIATQNT
jgi:hypothetical protein